MESRLDTPSTSSGKTGWKYDYASFKNSLIKLKDHDEARRQFVFRNLASITDFEIMNEALLAIPEKDRLEVVLSNLSVVKDFDHLLTVIDLIPSSTDKKRFLSSVDLQAWKINGFDNSLGHSIIPVNIADRLLNLASKDNSLSQESRLLIYWYNALKNLNDICPTSQSQFIRANEKYIDSFAVLFLATAFTEFTDDWIELAIRHKDLVKSYEELALMFTECINSLSTGKAAAKILEAQEEYWKSIDKTPSFSYDSLRALVRSTNKWDGSTDLQHLDAQDDFNAIMRLMYNYIDQNTHLITSCEQLTDLLAILNECGGNSGFVYSLALSKLELVTNSDEFNQLLDQIPMPYITKFFTEFDRYQQLRQTAELAEEVPHGKRPPDDDLNDNRASKKAAVTQQGTLFAPPSPVIHVQAPASPVLRT